MSWQAASACAAPFAVAASAMLLARGGLGCRGLGGLEQSQALGSLQFATSGELAGCSLQRLSGDSWAMSRSDRLWGHCRGHRRAATCKEAPQRYCHAALLPRTALQAVVEACTSLSLQSRSFVAPLAQRIWSMVRKRVVYLAACPQALRRARRQSRVGA